MLIARQGNQLVQIISFNGETVTVQSIKEESGTLQYGPTKEVDSNTVTEPCAAIYGVAKKYHEAKG